MNDIIFVLVMIIGTATGSSGWTTNQFGENTYPTRGACVHSAKLFYRNHPDVFNLKSIRLACVAKAGGVQNWMLIPND